MKKVLMSVALVSAIAIAAGYSMISSDKSEMSMSDLAQANVEALADDINSMPCAELGWDCTDVNPPIVSHRSTVNKEQ